MHSRNKNWKTRTRFKQSQQSSGEKKKKWAQKSTTWKIFRAQSLTHTQKGKENFTHAMKKDFPKNFPGKFFFSVLFVGWVESSKVNELEEKEEKKVLDNDTKLGHNSE